MHRLQLRFDSNSTDQRGRVPAFSLGPRLEGRRRRAGVGFVWRGHQPHPHHLEGLGRAVSSPIRGSGRSPDRPKFFHYFQHSGRPLLTLLLILLWTIMQPLRGKTPCPPPSCVRPRLYNHSTLRPTCCGLQHCGRLNI